MTTYRSKLTVNIRWTVTDSDGVGREHEEIRECGLLPVMVRVSTSLRLTREPCICVFDEV